MAEKRFNRRGNPWPEVTGMLNRRPEPGCPLCAIWGLPYIESDRSTHRRQHEHAALLWHEWDGRRDWPERVAAKASEITGKEITPLEARRHYRYHKPEQPAPLARLNRERALASLLSFPEISRALVTHIYRQRMLTFNQIVEVFYLSRLAPKSAEAQALDDLLPLIRSHALYRWFPPSDWARKPGRPVNIEKEVFYFLGREGGPWLEERYGITLPPEAHVQMARQIGLDFLIHDSEASQVFVRLHQALREAEWMVETGKGKAKANLPLMNWYGTRQTQMRLWDRVEIDTLDMRPDGFCSLALERSLDEPDRAPLQMPFFYEWDRGTKDQGDVARQMFAYHRLALSEKANRPGGIVGERFPALAIPGYAVPLIMIFNDKKRTESVQRSFLRLVTEKKISNGVPIYITDAASWNKDPLGEGIFRLAWDERRRPISLVAGLLLASRRLVESGSLSPAQELTIDWANVKQHSFRTDQKFLPKL